MGLDERLSTPTVRIVPVTKYLKELHLGGKNYTVFSLSLAHPGN
jgi:hypothetical protein